MTKDEHIRILSEGALAWNEWRFREETKRSLKSLEFAKTIDFTDTDLSYLNLKAANLRGINFSGADLHNTDLPRANLNSAILRAANLSKANLRFASLISADLSGADLTGSFLTGTNFYYADLTNADLTDSRMEGTNFASNDLSNVKGLAMVVHYGPSGVGIDTLYKSGGQIPAMFLRSCGVPDDFITYLPSLIGTNQSIQFYSCFISYSHRDGEFVKRLHSRLRDEHLRVWFAPENMKAGEKVATQIDTAIQVHDRLLLVLSEHSLQSDWVMTEIRKARKAEIREGRQKLFPIRLVSFEKLRKWECIDADRGQDLATEVREYFIPDFSNWRDHDVFETAFARLLKDLREAEGVKHGRRDAKQS